MLDAIKRVISGDDMQHESPSPSPAAPQSSAPSPGGDAAGPPHFYYQGRDDEDDAIGMQIDDEDDSSQANGNTTTTTNNNNNNTNMSFDPQKVLQEQQEAKRSQSWILTKIHDFQTAHNQLKHTVHTAWRYPLPPWGRAVMGCVYFSIPVVAGYAISNWVVSQSEATVEERFSDVDKNHIQGLGDKKVIKEEGGEQRVERVGAGGWGGGVHLATSDPETQDVNRVNLERFFKKQRRLKEKREREAANNTNTNSSTLKEGGAEEKEETSSQ